jgi:hypothetical protein
LKPLQAIDKMAHKVDKRLAICHMACAVQHDPVTSHQVRNCVGSRLRQVTTPNTDAGGHLVWQLGRITHEHSDVMA